MTFSHIFPKKNSHFEKIREISELELIACMKMLLEFNISTFIK